MYIYIPYILNKKRLLNTLQADGDLLPTDFLAPPETRWTDKHILQCCVFSVWETSVFLRDELLRIV